jgi:LPS-assembly protein
MRRASLGAGMAAAAALATSVLLGSVGIAAAQSYIVAAQPEGSLEGLPGELVAQTVDGDGLPILLRADEITQDQDLGIVVARGGVEIAQGERVLLADTLSYNQNAKTLTASGNVRILEPSGEVFFADYVELTEDMRDGTIENLRILLSDNARIAAAGGRRSNGNRTEMARAVYSPCEVCKDDPEADPLWQVKADRVVHDQAARQVEYYDAYLEVYGVPVAYSPYFTHPDPTVERQTGFLAPSVGSSSNAGFFLRTPFFWDIAPDRDVTVDPILADDAGGFLAGEYRQAFDNGRFEISGSGTFTDREIGSPELIETKDDVFRGHVFSEGEFHVDETWRWGWDANRSTDQTYLRKFSFWEDPGNSMTSELYAEGFRGRNYMSARAQTFQELRLGERSDTPLILPLLDYNGLGEADSWGGRWSLDANFRSLIDEDDADSQRFSVDAGYRKEFVSSFGLVTTITGNLRGDLYLVDQNEAFDENGRALDDGVVTRVIPRLGIEARYPFARYSIGGRQIIEPIVAVYAAPNGGNSADIPSVDSVVFETDDINLLTANRMPGLDRVETGQRVVAGVNMAHFYDRGGELSLFLGHSYRLRPDEDLKLDTGLENQRSDWVGRVEVSPNEYVNAFYRFSVEADELLANRNEFGLAVGGAGLRLTGNYAFSRDNLSPSATAIEQLGIGVESQFSEHWSGSANTVRDLRTDGGSLSHGARLVYEDECFIFDGTFVRSYLRSTDIQEEDSILLRLTFKTLGEVEF